LLANDQLHRVREAPSHSVSSDPRIPSALWRVVIFTCQRTRYNDCANLPVFC